MSRRRIVCLALAMVVVPVLAILGLQAPAAACPAAVDLEDVSVQCEYSPEETRDLFSSGDGHHYRVEPQCAHVRPDGSCRAEKACRSGGEPGIWYSLYRDGTGFGKVCLNPQEQAGLGVITTAMVQRAFRRLTWPEPELVIQPPGNKTLINFETLFYSTTPAGPTSQTVRLLGQRVTIQASPATYTWHSDPAGESWQTDDPSQRYRSGDDAEQLNHYVYEHPGDFRPSLDVTYTGRYRIGGGPWQDIPGDLTLDGPTQPLRVVEAETRLVY